MSTHLDSLYRRRWELYYTPNKIYDSREINWKQIPKDEVIKIEMYVEGHIYIIDNTDPSFKGFIRWRWGGFEFNGKVKIDIWTAGWHDGTTCHMTEVQFKDGSMERKEYQLKDYKVHLK